MALLGCSTSSFTADKQLHAHRKLRAEYAQSIRTRSSVEEGEIKNKPVLTYPWVETILRSDAPGLELYRNPATHAHVRDFFIELAGSEEVALPILYHAERQDVPLFLAFSLVFVESSFRIDAINQNPTSTDRGLFQLNNLSFPHLSLDDYFHPDTNAYHGVSYMRYTLDSMGDVERALAMYNAGRSRVVRNQIPESTVRYVQRVLSHRNQMMDEFRAYILETFPPTV
ncbi:transglycosylase SLT domain-containing protein [Spirochaeta africana]|nr:transglycosylase SLT domain-containing protein [Spirochaeta africana]